MTRKLSRAAELESQGLHPIVADVTDPTTLQKLPATDSVLFSVGIDRSTEKTVHDVYVNGLASVLSVLAVNTKRFVYISSTGVYGQNDGSWVDEDSICHPVREGGKACLAAERLLQSHPLGDRAVVLRLAGLYGPGRVPRKNEIQAGKPLQGVMNGFLNLIHVDDAAEVVTVAERSANVPGLYVVSDGHPVLRKDYFAEIARLCGLPSLGAESPDPVSSAAQRARADKRVRSDRFFRDLPITLKYPSYREGLAMAFG